MPSMAAVTVPVATRSHSSSPYTCDCTISYHISGFQLLLQTATRGPLTCLCSLWNTLDQMSYQNNFLFFVVFFVAMYQYFSLIFAENAGGFNKNQQETILKGNSVIKTSHLGNTRYKNN